MEFKLTKDYIELIKLLKLMGVAYSGSDAKEMVEKELVLVNGEIELRKRYKVKANEKVIVNGIEIKVI